MVAFVRLYKGDRLPSDGQKAIADGLKVWQMPLLFA